jgi:hypothetical protein
VAHGPFPTNYSVYRDALTLLDNTYGAKQGRAATGVGF